jgi:hypothetical protein
VESYDFAEKSLYRNRVWMQIDKRCKRPKALRKVVYLDTREALETIFLLDRGYRPENLLAVNREPVEVALLTQKLDRLGYPRVKTAGVEWERAIRERLGGHRADILNFDGMGNYSLDLVNLLRSSVHIARPRVVAVNMLAGRETGFASDVLFDDASDRLCGGCRKTSSGKDVRETHLKRAFTIVRTVTMAAKGVECDWHVDSWAWDTYRSSSGQPMVWTVFEISEHRNMSTIDAHKVLARNAQGETLFLVPDCVMSRISDPDMKGIARLAKQAWRGYTFSAVAGASV